METYFPICASMLRLDQGVTDVYSCPTCRRPLFLFNSQDPTSSTPGYGSNNDGLLEQVNLGLDQPRLSGRALPVGLFPNQQQNPSDAMWRFSFLHFNLFFFLWSHVQLLSLLES